MFLHQCSRVNGKKAGSAMRVASLVHRLRQHLRNLRDAEDGNVAIIFTIALLPIIGLTGAAIDYSRASSVRAAMQAALDATALAMSKDAATLTSAQLNTKASQYFAAAFNRPEAGSVTISAAYSTSGGSSVTVTGAGEIKTTMLGVMGINSIPIGSTAKTAWGMGKLRVALVLDNSGSMADGGRMTALKTATKDLLTTLENAAASPGDVRVAIVPFNENVNVGASNYNQPWIDWTAWDAANASSSSTFSGSICFNGQLWTVNGSSWSYGGTCTTSAGICYNGTLWKYNGSTFYTEGSCGNASHSTWNGCVMDRDQDYDVQNTTPTSDKTTKFPAEQSIPCPSSIMALNYNWTSLKIKVDAMVPAGYTNQPIGLVWGWHALTPSLPMNAPANDNKTQEYIILLSDGNNTRNRFYNGSDAEEKINARQKKVCDNIKAAGIQIYSVLLIEGNESVMKDCASKPEMFFKLTSTNQVVSAFSKIGTNMAKLRLTK
jgi:Flp pilus assembly protein TadG